jgi:hypothetical protein
MAEGVAGLLHEATRPAGKPPLPAAVIERVIEMTAHRQPFKFGEIAETIRDGRVAEGASARRSGKCALLQINN